MKQTNQKIHTQLTTLVSSASNQDKLQDAIVTMRNGRYCIPVKQEYRSSFQGMIHDQSASGNTLFIEPMSVVTLNNELKELEGKEQSEIEHILSILSEQASYGVDDLAHNQKTLVLLQRQNMRRILMHPNLFSVKMELSISNRDVILY